MSNNIIEVSRLTKRYGSLTAVDNLTFGIGKGKIYGFLGPNGAGKSTTMNMMTGYLAPSEGTVVVNGHDIYKEPDKAKKSIGYLPEIPPLYTDMTVNEYLMFAAELKGIDKKDRKAEVQRCAERTGLGDVCGRLIANLSKGFRQRAGIAQAMLGSPEVVILDEPTVGLDPRQIIEIRSLIKDLGRDHTVILSSHILSEIAAVCDTIMIISHGKLAADGTPEELRKKLSGGVKLEVAAKCSNNRIKEVLSGLNGIASTTLLLLENEDRNVNGVTLTMKDGAKDIREEVFRRFADAGIPLVRLCRTEQTLEDVFLKLTSDDTADNAAEGAGTTDGADNTAGTTDTSEAAGTTDGTGNTAGTAETTDKEAEGAGTTDGTGNTSETADTTDGADSTSETADTTDGTDNTAGTTDTSEAAGTTDGADNTAGTEDASETAGTTDTAATPADDEKGGEKA